MILWSLCPFCVVLKVKNEHRLTLIRLFYSSIVVLILPRSKDITNFNFYDCIKGGKDSPSVISLNSLFCLYFCLSVCLLVYLSFKLSGLPSVCLSFFLPIFYRSKQNEMAALWDRLRQNKIEMLLFHLDLY